MAIITSNRLAVARLDELESLCSDVEPFDQSVNRDDVFSMIAEIRELRGICRRVVEINDSEIDGMVLMSLEDLADEIRDRVAQG